ncbi:DUF6241 domain-containing protein [Proteinivorax hydrogeniformans]|uniref:DUF6241 domain-containing protein n=1 Tax=Proteinivorax hydrogeniformans TaxID=1826727 RepID=A0AAU8HUZ4_9FIRM
MNKKIILPLLLLIPILIVVGILFTDSNDEVVASFKSDAPTEVTLEVYKQIREQDYPKEKINKYIEPRSLQAIWNDIHHMSHVVIEADEKWGVKDLSLENINALILEMKVLNWDKTDHSQQFIQRQEEEILDILYRWQSGDFSKADQDHNTVWRFQGGT